MARMVVVVVVVRNNEQNSPVGGYYGGDNGGDEYGSIAGRDVAMVLVIRWLEAEQRLTNGGPKWRRC